MMRFYEFVELNKSKGFHWFDKSTMRFFKTRIIHSTWDSIAGYFITSERNTGVYGGPYPRMYTIRKADFETGNVDTIGQFQQFKSLSGAKGALKRLQQGKGL